VGFEPTQVEEESGHYLNYFNEKIYQRVT